MSSIRKHQIYTNYGYDPTTNNIMNIINSNILKQNNNNSGYLTIHLSQDHKHKSFMAHRFIWECCNTIIPEGYEIDHINKIKTDNTIDNLRCITMQENRKYRDHTKIIQNASKAYTLVRYIKAINRDTNDFNCFKSKSQCAKYFNISPALIYLIIENRIHTANTNMGKYYFEYIDENDVENFIKIPHGNLGKTYKSI